MSSHPAIRVEALAKRYLINHQHDRRDGMRHRLERTLTRPFRWARGAGRPRVNGMDPNHRDGPTREEFWALQDVSFAIARGEAVGIIGRNGAGKSTLLKLLSRITEPTRGRIQLDGRVASLLEVGTGFHQELTGRENIFLNGAILGMSHAEIRRKFDAIVAFSEIEQFLDTPVKRYSSGMYVRLAFAVAAHLEPEILIVDEVLAVGDAQFQKKCMGKMDEVSKQGRTVLFVSHNIAAIQTLCTKAVYLQQGRVRSFDEVQTVTRQYLADTGNIQKQHCCASMPLGGGLKLGSLEFSPAAIENGASLQFELTLTAEQPTILNELSLLVYSWQQIRVALLDLRHLDLPVALRAGESWHVSGTIKSLPLVEGDYSIGLFVRTPAILENFLDLATVSVNPRPSAFAYAPYALTYRGVVEFDYTANARVHRANARAISLV